MARFMRGMHTAASHIGNQFAITHFALSYDGATEFFRFVGEERARLKKDRFSIIDLQS